PLPSEYGFPPPSEAERIAHLQRSIDEQRKYLEKLNGQINDPKSDYNETEKRFQSVDSEREAARQEIRDLKAAGKTVSAASEANLKDLDERWQQFRDRFNLAIQERKTLQESIAAARRQLDEDEKALAHLSGASSDPSSPASASSAPHDAAAPAATEKNPPAESSPRSAAAVPALPLTLASPASAPPASASSPNAAADQSANRVSREVERAREEAKLKEEAAKKAESKAQSISERIDTLNENIALTKKLLEEARRSSDFEQHTKSQLENELKQKTSAKAPAAELHDISSRIASAQQRFQKALDEVRSTTDHLHDLQTELSHLQAAQIRALHDADAKKQAADAAEERIAQLQNPFRPRNILHWLLHHGPRLLLIALGTFIFYRLSRVLSHRLVQIMAQGPSKRGTRQDRENRAETLVGVFNSALSLLILGGGSLMMLDEVGIPIVPLMGGAAVIGLAVAFGAQNLIKDYFSGFMVLLEDQYGINDVVKIGEISGLVEYISLRTTVLRDLEGIVHFIPHGTITTVSNQTHGWSRALFDVGIDYKEDTDRVMEVLLEIGRDLRRDPAFGSLILDDPEMLGVDQLADSSVIIKFFLKTRPLQQWTVKREMLRRIKKRFDELGIEIPYPHQTVHHRYDSPPPDVPPFSRAA
ncbi:MAG TPA: mechanosensitive ion channel domain-containing protein, partial [Gemmataceae bacterium]|nr:mechanosensitive ion channel domain-containing protein [Gemmataceae bacterium]